jgi:hypothetical protein
MFLRDGRAAERVGRRLGSLAHVAPWHQTATLARFGDPSGVRTPRISRARARASSRLPTTFSSPISASAGDAVVEELSPVVGPKRGHEFGEEHGTEVRRSGPIITMNEIGSKRTLN